MSFTEQLKVGASEIAAKAKEGAGDTQAKLELGKAQAELGAKSFELIETGAIRNEKLEPIAARIRDLNAKLAKEPVA